MEGNFRFYDCVMNKIHKLKKGCLQQNMNIFVTKCIYVKYKGSYKLSLEILKIPILFFIEVQISA